MTLKSIIVSIISKDFNLIFFCRNLLIGPLCGQNYYYFKMLYFRYVPPPEKRYTKIFEFYFKQLLHQQHTYTFFFRLILQTNTIFQNNLMKFSVKHKVIIVLHLYLYICRQKLGLTPPIEDNL